MYCPCYCYIYNIDISYHLPMNYILQSYLALLYTELPVSGYVVNISTVKKGEYPLVILKTYCNVLVYKFYIGNDKSSGAIVSSDKALKIIKELGVTVSSITREILNTPGPGTWTVPNGVTSIGVQAIGAGGNGAVGNNGTAGVNNSEGITQNGDDGGGGGGSGQFITVSSYIIPSSVTTLPFSIGTGGTSNRDTWLGTAPDYVIYAAGGNDGSAINLIGKNQAFARTPTSSITSLSASRRILRITICSIFSVSPITPCPN